VLRLFLILVLLVPAAWAQEVLPREKAQKQKQLKQQQRENDIVERLLAMPPRQRERLLSQLPEERRRRILARLEVLELLSPEERGQLRGRFDAFSAFPPPRQRLLRRELQNLRNLQRPEVRRRRLAELKASGQFSEEEMQLLYEVSGAPPPPEE
jgi:hypothetical protein